jgi:hypothetical protein
MPLPGKVLVPSTLFKIASLDLHDGSAKVKDDPPNSGQAALLIRWYFEMFEYWRSGEISFFNSRFRIFCLFNDGRKNRSSLFLFGVKIKRGV